MAEHTQDENKRIYEIAKLHPDKIIQVYWVNLLSKDCIKKLDEDYKKYKFKMIKMHQNKYCTNINDKKNIMYENIFKILKKTEI